jgi:hypothetical protein
MEIAMTMPDLMSGLEKRLSDELAREAYEWALLQKGLSRWEDEHLLDNPGPELIAEHKQTLDRLLRFGRRLAVVTGNPDLPDRKTAEMVETTLWLLETVHTRWHQPQIARERADEILAAAFPDEP